jgi:hypothetical protein
LYKRHLVIDLTQSCAAERELFAGDRESEKRAEDKLNRLLKGDALLQNRVKELGGLLQEVRQAMPK